MVVDIDKIIYSYMFICLVLLFYNVLYIFYSSRREKKYRKRVTEWVNLIKRQVNLIYEGKTIEPEHKEFIQRKLTNINELISFTRALDILRKEEEKLGEYLKVNYTEIQSLAYYYKKRESMDKAFFAFFISKNSPYDGKEYRPIMEILISYLDNSTVYCRENVLNALYSLGNAQAVENALQIINDQGWFHHQKLLADGLMNFSGDKEELTELLWSHQKRWDKNLMVSVVQYITATSDKFKERFFESLQSKDVDIEIKLAILRYYRRYTYEPIRPLLLSYLNGENVVGESMMIVAASVLEKYPGEDTIEALKNALHHSNWYFRYNAASSLVNLKVNIAEMQDVFKGKDRYAKEILTYMIEQRKEEKNS